MFHSLRKLFGRTSKFSAKSSRSSLKKTIRGSFETLEARQVLAYEFIGSFQVPVTNGNWNTPTYQGNSIYLENEVAYQVVASGTALMSKSPNRLTDAEFYQPKQPNGSVDPNVWEDKSLVPGTTHNLGVRLKGENSSELFFSRWSDNTTYINYNHIYSRDIKGTGANLQVSYVDSNYTDNGNGSLKVDVYGKIAGDLDILGQGILDGNEVSTGGVLAVGEFGQLKIESLHKFGASGDFKIEYDEDEVTLYDGSDLNTANIIASGSVVAASQVIYAKSDNIGTAEIKLSYHATSGSSGEEVDRVKLTIFQPAGDLAIDLPEFDASEEDTPGVTVFVNQATPLIVAITSAYASAYESYVIHFNSAEVSLSRNAYGTDPIFDGDMVSNGQQIYATGGNIGSALIGLYWQGLSGPTHLLDTVLMNFANPTIDLDVDSKNDSGFAEPDENEPEETLESDATKGKFVFVQNGDLDNDTTYDRDDLNGIDGAKFVPMVIRIPTELQNMKIGLNDIKLKFDYNEATTNGTGINSGLLRLWKTDASSDRTAGSSLIAHEQEYSAQSLGLKFGNNTIYVEAVKGSETNTPVKVTATFKGVSGGDDTVHFSPVSIETPFVTFEASPGETDKFINVFSDTNSASTSTKVIAYVRQSTMAVQVKWSLKAPPNFTIDSLSSMAIKAKGTNDYDFNALPDGSGDDPNNNYEVVEIPDPFGGLGSPSRNLVLNATASKAFSNNVEHYENYTQKWTLELGEGVKVGLSEKVISLYTLLNKPITVAASISETAAKTATLFAKYGSSSSEQLSNINAVQSAIWSIIQTRAIVSYSGVEMAYNHDMPDDTGFTSYYLYANNTGRCGAWAEFLVDVFRAQGIDAIKVKVDIKLSEIPDPPAGYNKDDASGIVVFQGSAQGSGGNNYRRVQFTDHAIVRVNGVDNVLYDPSYGTMFYADTKEDVKQQWEFLSVEKYAYVYKNPTILVGDPLVQKTEDRAEGQFKLEFDY